MKHTRPSAPLRLTAVAAAAAAATVGLALSPAPASASGMTWYVGKTSCSDNGSGTSSKPFCTVARGVKAAFPGDTVKVAAGTYRESVSFPRNGTSTARITVAGAPGAILSGAVSLAKTSLWTSEGSGSFTTRLATDPKVVTIDGTRAPVTTAAKPASGRWRWADGVLHVSIGGANPGTKSVEAGKLSTGFVISNHSYITVKGMQVQRQTSYGISVTTGSHHVTVSTNTVRQTGSYGIRASGAGAAVLFSGNDVSSAGSVGIVVKSTDAVVVRDNRSHSNLNHGISVQDSAGSIVEGNTAYSNAKTTAKSAVGIDVSAASSKTVVQRNVTYKNQDSGVQVYNGSTGTVVRRNLSYRNGDHGFDTLKATGTTYSSNTAFGNTTDGISVEGTSTGTSLNNNILSDNHEYDLWVDTTSWSGFSANDDIIWNSFGGYAVTANGSNYVTLGSFASATKQESRGKGSDPRFNDPSTGDFSLKATSPAIDSANAGAGSFSSLDRKSRKACDYAGVANTGLGTPTYADRGAYERGC